MTRLALACLLTGCSYETLSLHPAVEQTPARKTAIDFARRNPHMAVGRIRPDGRMFEVRDRESGRLLLVPEAEVRTGVLTVVACPARPPAPGALCFSLNGRLSAFWETRESVAAVARQFNAEADSAFTAAILRPGLRVYIDRHDAKSTKVFEIH